MRYFKIFQDGIEINHIVADDEFVNKYCESNGYTYEEYTMPKPETPDTEDSTESETESTDTDPVTWDILAQAYTEGVNSIDE